MNQIFKLAFHSPYAVIISTQIKKLLMVGFVMSTTATSRVHPKGRLERTGQYVRAFVGVFFASFMKMYGFQNASLVGATWMFDPAVQSIAIVWELILGLWLLSGLQPIGSWLFALLTFIVFAIVSGKLGLLGQGTCGCLGRVVEINPWIAFSIDCLILVGLVLCRPDINPLRINPVATIRQMLIVGCLITVTFLSIYGVVCLTFYLCFGSIGAGIAYLRDEPLSVSPKFIDFGLGTPGQEMQTSVFISNWDTKTVRLIGGSSSCNCLATSSLPIEIPSMSTEEIIIKYRVPTYQKNATTTQEIEVWTDCQKQRTLRLIISSRIMAHEFLMSMSPLEEDDENPFANRSVCFWSSYGNTLDPCHYGIPITGNCESKLLYQLLCYQLFMGL